MHSRHSLVVVNMTVAAFAAFAAERVTAAASAQGPALRVLCGSSESKTDVYTQRGTKCTSASDPTTKRQDAVNNANGLFQAWLDSAFYCDECATTQCTKTTGTSSNPLFTIADCTFTYQQNCQGNPLKTLVIANCTKNLTWIVSCDYCHD
jgi:hypothetical protein